MNYSALVLLLIGLGVLVVGFTGSQNALCQSIFGGNCSWLPGRETTTKVGTGTVGGNTPTNSPTSVIFPTNTVPVNYSSSWVAL